MLKKPQRITSNKDFQNTYRRGRHYSSAFFGLNYLSNIYGKTRIGIVVNKKIARKAHDRNLLKRQLREIVRAEYNNLKPGADIIITTRGNILKLDYKKLTDELKSILTKSNLIK